MSTIPQHTLDDIAEVNGGGRTPVVFIHGLWLLPSSGTVGLRFQGRRLCADHPGLAGRPRDGRGGQGAPEVFAGKTVGQVADHYAEVIGKLDKQPALIGHSFGGLLAMILAGRGLSNATVAIDAAPFRGVLPLPISALRSSAPVLSNRPT